mmetsp:Transcript_7485/g.23933  ORF Transcript_7485/g.23933 Transcript_7485/m.23933 type:complete len:193 (-) Transcript_7485:930-1508(-)
MPRVRTRLMASCTMRSDAESRALVASSRMRMDGRRSSARAMAMRCFCPPDTWVADPSPRTVSYPSGSAAIKSWAKALRATSSISSSVGEVPGGAPNAMFARIDRANSAGSCRTVDTDSRSRSMGTSLMGMPPTRTSPASPSGTSYRRCSRDATVDLPQPDSPMSARAFPLPTVKEMPRSTGTLGLDGYVKCT